MAEPGGAKEAARSPQIKAFVDYCADLGNADVLVKNVSYVAGLAACAFRWHDRRGGSGGEVAAELQKIYGDLSLARMVYRFHGTQDAIDAYRNDTWSGASDSGLIKELVRAQALTMVAYHPLEHLYWAAYVAPRLFRLGRKHGDRVAQVGAASCWFWTLYVVIDIFATHLRLKAATEEAEELERRLKTASRAEDRAAKKTPETGAVDCSEIEARLEALRRRRRRCVLQMWRNVFYLPNAVHWSFPRGLLPEALVQAFGLAEGVLALVQGYPGFSP